MPQHEHNRADYWKPKTEADLTLFKGDFTTFAYDRHTHDEFALGVIEQGRQRFYHKGSIHRAPPGAIITINPDEVHDGETDTDAGYRYRMVYVGPEYLRETFHELFAGPELRAFSASVTRDPHTAFLLRRAMHLSEQHPEAGEQALIPALYQLFSSHARPVLPPAPRTAGEAGVRAALERIAEHPEAPAPLDTLAARAGVSKFHFLRVFKTITGLAPHAYLMRRRVSLARRLLLQGTSICDAAVAAGFADQSHLTRLFKAAYGVAPGTFLKQIG